MSRPAQIYCYSPCRQSRKATTVVLALLFSLLSDVRFSFTASAIKPIIPGYAVLVLHGLASAGLEHTQSVLAPVLGTSVAMLASTLGATVVALPFYLFKILLVRPASCLLELSSLLDSLQRPKRQQSQSSPSCPYRSWHIPCCSSRRRSPQQYALRRFRRVTSRSHTLVLSFQP